MVLFGNIIKMKLSIIIPTLYQDNYYEDVIRNIFEVCTVPFEIITIENKLVNEARNVWVAQAKWDYILVINDDIIIKEWTIDRLIQLLDHHMIACPYFTRADDPKVYSSTGKKIIGFCYMFKASDKDKLFPIPSDLKLWYWDDWLYHRCDLDMWLWWHIHHYESRTILGKEHKERCDKIIERDKYAWESFYKLI